MVGTGSVAGERVVEAGVIDLPGVSTSVPAAGHAGTNKIVSEMMAKTQNAGEVHKTFKTSSAAPQNGPSSPGIPTNPLGNRCFRNIPCP